MNRSVDRFIEEIRTAPKFVAAAKQDLKWLDELAAIERSLEALFRSELTVAVNASDRIAAIVGDTSAPLKQRLLAVMDAMSEVVRRDG